MQTMFTVVQQVLYHYAGSLIEWSGEGFVALFGAPVAQEDHAQRAVLAALALHAQVGTSTRPQASARARSPVSGPAHGPGGGGPPRGRSATTLHGRQRDHTGGAAAAAARGARHDAAQCGAAPGARGRVGRVAGEVTVSKAHAPVPVYGVRGMARQRSGVVGHGARRAVPSWDGRGSWLLQERLDTVVAGQGQVVAVVGEPGMGKSRLLAEFRRSLVGREVRYVEGHCLSYGSATPYLPVLDLVRQLCAITPGEQHEAITATVHRRLQQAELDPDEGGH